LIILSVKTEATQLQLGGSMIFAEYSHRASSNCASVSRLPKTVLNHVGKSRAGVAGVYQWYDWKI
jgi:hypothetical protein